MEGGLNIGRSKYVIGGGEIFSIILIRLGNLNLNWEVEQ